jgi:hypothetical protein
VLQILATCSADHFWQSTHLLPACELHVEQIRAACSG